MSRPSAADPDPTSAALAAATTAVAAWRAAHPDATLAEIERAVDAHLSGPRAALITTLATAEELTDRPGCPDCGAVLVRNGARRRRLRTTQGGEVALEEMGWRCPACGAGFSPPDRAAGPAAGDALPGAG